MDARGVRGAFPAFRRSGGGEVFGYRPPVSSLYTPVFGDEPWVSYDKILSLF